MSDTTTRTPEQIALLREGYTKALYTTRAFTQEAAEEAARERYPDPKPPLRWRKASAGFEYAIEGDHLLCRSENSVAGVSPLNTALIRQLAADSYDTGELVVPVEAVNAARNDLPYTGRLSPSEARNVLRAALPHLLAANVPQQLKAKWWVVVNRAGEHIGTHGFNGHNNAIQQRDMHDKVYPCDAPHRVVALAEVPNV